MNNRTLWTIVGVVLLVFIALLAFGVIALPVNQIPETTTSTSAAANAIPAMFAGASRAPVHAFIA